MGSDTANNPAWWNDEMHGNAWVRIRDALRRDWEQTKADLTRGRKGVELDQSAKDTVREAVGRGPPKEEWKRVEPGYRYGFGAAHQYPERNWDSGLETKLREEWSDLRSGRTWEEMKDYIRRGWNAARGGPRTA